jgi:hypothetical protein
MPKRCHARAPTDAAEAAQIRKLAQSHHAPYDCKQRAQMIALSWEGLRTGEIACHLRCHPQTVRERFERFRTEGLDGLTNRPGTGRKARLTERERSQLIALVAQTPPGRPARQADGQLQRFSNGLTTIPAMGEVALRVGRAEGRERLTQGSL